MPRLSGRAGGIVDRFRSMDTGGPAVLFGHVAANVARNTVSTALVLGVGYLVGFRPHASGLAWLGTVGVLLMFVLGVLLAVGRVRPAGRLARGGQRFADNQPVTPIVETLRGLLLSQPVGGEGWRAVAWCAGITVASILLTGALSRRRTE